MKFSAKNPRLRKVAKRYRQFLKKTRQIEQHIKMDFTVEKEYLKNIFSPKQLEVTEETDNSLTISRRTFITISFAEEDLLSLKNYLNIRSEYENLNFETSLISKDYREELVDVINQLTFTPLFWRGEKYTFGTENDVEMYAQIDRCSNKYAWNKLENENYLEYVLGRFRMIRGETNYIKVTERFSTLKIYNIGENNAENCFKMTNGIIDSCIFSISSLKQTAITLLEFFPQRRRRVRETSEIFKIQASNHFNFPRVKINPHLLKFYQLASSTEFESHKFLSYYHILEYFFLSVSDQNLYEKMSRRINDPKFKTIAKDLDKLIFDISSHKTENDETEMLKNVLAKFVIEDELIDFIKEYEEKIEENIFTKKKDLFGIEISGTNLQSGHVFGPIAKHIKTIRNAIVHSSDRHERNTRFIPYSKTSMTTLKNEIPVLKFIAEKIIIATAD